jgi:hypothetical protein|nr:hypothetical protein [Neorhizobium tomejilense]
MNTHRYTVSGHWPFPLDMLRRDGSMPATPEDDAKIRALTKDHCDDRGTMLERHSIDLVFVNPGPRSRPLEERWESFTWRVEGGELEVRKAERRMALRDSAMAKLTAEEREAVRWYRGR